MKWVFVVALAIAPCAAVAAEGLSADECAVWNRELSFAQSVDNHDAAAFAAHVHPGAVFDAATAEPVRGRAAVTEGWAGIIEGKAIKLVWRPQFVSIGGDPNVAVSRGPFYIENPVKHRFAVGNFSSVWTRKNSSALWLVLFDGGGPPPTPVTTEAEALAYIAAAPKDCPKG